MKLLMGFIILLVALVAVTGCTQTASTTTPATTATTVPPATEVTTAATMVPTTVETTIPVNATTMTANVTAPSANATTEPVTTMANVTVATTPTPATGVTKISLTSAGFTPQTDIVLPGSGVSFVNNDNVTHTIIAVGNSTGMFNSGALIPGEAFQYTFNTDAGTVTYALADNSSVTGTIIVQSPGAGHSSVS